MSVLARAVLAVVFPVIMFVGGGWLMLVTAGASADRAVTRMGKPLNQRWNGYTRDEVQALWGGLEEHDLEVERRLVIVDLVFPFVYGGALALSLLALWATIGRPFPPGWLMLPVIVAVVADWTENLVQLRQLNRFIDAAAIDAGPIAVASAATVVKLGSLTVAAACVALLFLLALVRGRAAA